MPPLLDSLNKPFSEEVFPSLFSKNVPDPGNSVYVDTSQGQNSIVLLGCIDQRTASVSCKHSVVMRVIPPFSTLLLEVFITSQIDSPDW